MLTGVEVLVGGSRLLHVEDTVQAYTNPAGFNERQHVFAYTAQNLSLLLIRTGAQAPTGGGRAYTLGLLLPWRRPSDR